jgi:hypothetical protein
MESPETKSPFFEFDTLPDPETFTFKLTAPTKSHRQERLSKMKKSKHSEKLGPRQEDQKCIRDPKSTAAGSVPA